ncbi:hypothetical protein Sru01_16930 [Sphaerisporangium rufum]|uniref:UspA domain-containing protein n=1 Tax=Sphaerisporangium rufum TaxID=1381558 RepID=A0A919R1J9_9ACTN|nr:universal stress protein [Sphaerisporangium rufum]GII76711.1 hypothetical protein Sru01_16930 [Sphaerisporangium rufum]
MSERIVVGTDGSPAGTAAVRWAAADAARRGAPLHIVTVVERWPYSVARWPAPPEIGDSLEAGAERVLAEAEAVARATLPDGPVSTERIDGEPAPALCEHAEKALVLVVGSRGLGGFTGALVGSVSGHVAGRARGAVVVVREGAEPRRGEVVAGVDDSAECDPALVFALEEARLRGAVLRAVHAWQPPVHVYAPAIAYDMDEIRQAQHDVVRERLARLAPRYPEVTVVEDVRCAHPVDALVKAADGAELLVVGSHGRGAVGSALLGSVSRSVLHHAAVPTAVVRG